MLSSPKEASHGAHVAENLEPSLEKAVPYSGPGPPWVHTWSTIQLMLQESSRSGRGAGEGLQARAGGPSAGSGAGQETASSGQGEKKVAERAHFSSGLGILVLVQETEGEGTPWVIKLDGVCPAGCLGQVSGDGSWKDKAGDAMGK